MAGRLEKIFWSLLCGTALGAAGCSDPDANDLMYGPPPYDYSTDDVSDTLDAADGTETVEDVLEDEASEDVQEDEMPAGAYGPPPDF